VSFDAKSASGVSVVDDTTVRCIAPNGPDRTWPEITLLNANGKASIAGEFRWLSRNPNDLDEDGLGDALVSGEDAVYVFFGTASGLEDESTAAADLVLLPSTSGTDFGAQLACGDVNADQIVDLIVSAPLDGAGGSGTGAVFVFFGPLAPSPTPRAAGSASAVFHGAANYDHFGSSVSVCDVTGDGQADLLVGAPLNDASGSNGGAVYVFRGSAAFTGKSAGQANVRLIAKDREEYFGSALACGDVTGDRIADIVVGAPHIGATGNDTGTAYLFRGGASLTSANADAAAFRLDGVSRRDLLGSSVVVADFDGDGIGDLLLGAPGVSGDAGALYWLRGGPTLSSRRVDVSSVELDAESSGDLLGQVVAAGDVDGDGKADLLASAPRHDVPSANAGRAYLVRGGTFQDGGIAARAHTIFLAENSSGDLFGSGLGIIDLDGDGAGDVLIGAPFSNRGGQDSGQVYLFLGSALQVTRSAGADDATLTGAAASLTLGREIGGTR